MESRLAQEARQALMAATQRLTPEQRLQAFAQHCQLMVALSVASAGKSSATSSVPSSVPSSPALAVGK
jgi:hypothetical protein